LMTRAAATAHLEALADDLTAQRLAEFANF
jgi:hypothetical protein